MLANRKGFVRVAVEEGLDGGIVPVYHFGNTQVRHLFLGVISSACTMFVRVAVEEGLDGGILPVYHYGNSQVRAGCALPGPARMQRYCQGAEQAKGVWMWQHRGSVSLWQHAGEPQTADAEIHGAQRLA
jgi:hypothetical protein